MARAQPFDSASSQFFIVHEDSTFLDGQYAAFGYVTGGMDVVDQIACVPTVKNEDETDTYRPQEDSTVTIYKVTIDNYPGPSADDTADSAASDSSAQ